MPLSSTHRAWIAIASLAAIALLGLALFYHYERRTRPVPWQESDSALTSYQASPQQAARTFDLIAELPGNAPVVGYIDVESLRKLQRSPLAKLLGLTRDLHSSQDRDYQRFIHETGFDYARDLDRAAVAYWPTAPATSSKSKPSDSRAYALAEGRFDQKKIVAYALKSGGSLLKSSRTVYLVPGSPAIAFEFQSPDRVALASGVRPEDLLLSPTAKIDSAFRAQLDRVAGAPLFAAARADHLSSSFYANFSSSPQIGSLARSIQNLTFAALPQNDIINVSLEAQTTTTQNALAIATLLDISRMGASFALSSPKTGTRITTDQSMFLNALVSQTQINHQGRTVRIHLDITPTMLNETDAAPPTSTR